MPGGGHGDREHDRHRRVVVEHFGHQQRGGVDHRKGRHRAEIPRHEAQHDGHLGGRPGLLQGARHAEAGPDHDQDLPGDALTRHRPADAARADQKAGGHERRDRGR